MKRSFQYRRNSAESRLELVFDGLDTYADVYVNGELTLTADNMFRRWRVDIKERIVSGDNRISVRFRSPILEDLPKLERLGYTLPAANDQSVLGGLEDKKVSVFARKAPYHYGWDWVHGSSRAVYGVLAGLRPGQGQE